MKLLYFLLLWLVIAIPLGLLIGKQLRQLNGDFESRSRHHWENAPWNDIP